MNVKTSLSPFRSENDKHRVENGIKLMNQRMKYQAHDKCRRVSMIDEHTLKYQTK